MAEIPRYILDASVGVKWHLTDEVYRSQALAVRENFINDHVRLVAPDFITHEVVAALLKATRNPERAVPLLFQAGQREVEAWLSWGVELVPSNLLAPDAYRLAGRFGCSYYDALYLALAEQTDTPFLHADRKLRNALSGRFPHEVWIENYTA